MSNSKGKQAYRAARALIRANGRYAFRFIQAGEAKNALLLVEHARQDLLALRASFQKGCSKEQAFCLTLDDRLSGMLMRPQAS